MPIDHHALRIETIALETRPINIIMFGLSLMTFRPLIRLMMITALTAMVAGPALAADTQRYAITEYPLPANSSNTSAMSIDGRNGDVWLIQDSPPVLYRLSRENSTFASYTIKGFDGAGFTGLSIDDGGTVWFADMKGNRVGGYEPGTNHTTTFEFPGPMAPSSVIRKGDTIWIGCKEEIGEQDLGSGKFYDHFVYKMDSYLYDIHIDRVNNVWFVENRVNKVGAYYRMYDKTIEFVIPTNNSYPTCLDIDSKSRLWFVESGPNKLGMFDMEQFNFTEYNMTAIDGKVPVLSHVAAVNDTVWLTDAKNDRVLEFYPQEGQVAAAKLGNGTTPTLIKAGVNGTLWTYEAGSKKLAQIRIRPEFGDVTPTIKLTPAAFTTKAFPSPSASAGIPGEALILTLAAFLYAIWIEQGKNKR